MSRVAVIIATRGRAALVGRLIESLRRQTRPAGHVFVVGSQPDDIAGLADGDDVTARVGRLGSSPQRNDGIDLAAGRFDYLAFFDDDFVPSRFWLERMAALFDTHPDLAGLTGTVLRDGIRTPGIPIEEGEALVAARDAVPPNDEGGLDARFGPYGCNMAFRTSAIAGLRFDERLPLYAWLEDSDFGGQVARRGATARAEALWGVHLGNKTGRERGIRLGYSQIANPCYLVRKGTVPLGASVKLMARNMAANAAKALTPEPFIDRPGRLRGNILAIGDLMRGRLRPERAAEL